MVYENEETIRVRVTSVRFPPIPTPAQLKASYLSPGSIDSVGTKERPYAPMIVVGSVALAGLGDVRWWEEGEGQAEEEGDEGQLQEEEAHMS